jgi:hypothetical protein
MTATVERAARTNQRRRTRRQNAALLVIASLIGLWFGTSAPSTSPVAPAAPPAPTVTSQLPTQPPIQANLTGTP